MAYYIKVTKAVADKMGLTAIRNKTADGNVILWQSDLAKFGERGDNIFVRAKIVGGIALTAVDAKKEIDGTDTPVVPVTPVEFGGTGLPEESVEEPQQVTDEPAKESTLSEEPNEEEEV